VAAHDTAIVPGIDSVAQFRDKYMICYYVKFLKRRMIYTNDDMTQSMQCKEPHEITSTPIL